MTAAEMRAAEEAVIAAGTPVYELMERAGKAAAEAIWRYAGPLPALVLCGPGNNGGDGYVIARELAARGVDVRVASLSDPRSAAARQARERWTDPVSSLADAAPAPLLIDALFGTGLARPLDDDISRIFLDLAKAASIRVAIDLPSGAGTDDGTILSPVPDFDLTITFQTLKPSHMLQPAARHMGRMVVADIGVAATGSLTGIARPRLHAPGPDAHKYSRGYVAVIAGEMPGACALAASAAARTGAGYVRVAATAEISGMPKAVVQSPGKLWRYLDDARIDVCLVGPGLGLGDEAKAIVRAVLKSAAPAVFDADALSCIADLGLHVLQSASRETQGPAILTPHEGEFQRLFGRVEGSKVGRARAAAAQAGSVIIYKGADTVVAAPDGRAAIAPPAPAWLASAGTGDVLAGIVAASRAGGMEAFEAACAAVWLHGRAAELAGPFLVADDLLASLPAALAECL